MTSELSSTRFAPTRTSKTGAFTLIEMLVVVAIIALIVAAMAPLVFSSLSASRLTAAGEVMAAQISFARQRAVSLNEEIEVRFYAYDDPEAAGNQVTINAMGMYRTTLEVSGSSAKPTPLPVAETYYLPSGVVIADSPVLSRLLTSAKSEVDQEGAILKASATYRAFRFMPDGTTNILEVLGASGSANQFYNQSYFSLVESRFFDSADVPKNFFAIQVDPSTGRVTSYRP
jgi:uncharacterized protein (TIGR02596 family)